MKIEYRETIRYWHEKLPKLQSNEKIVSCFIDGSNTRFGPPVMIIIIEKKNSF